ncbi:MAG: pantoate--beta-alanine ligase, partial [Armatimonadetes bacterium]|nr:pantoate--beta-alanine ligase [Armatimonadota bacterium]
KIAGAGQEGAAFQGGVSSIDNRKSSIGVVVVSIFINPTQFGDGEDPAAYPRDEERDLRLAEAAGCDLAFLPLVEEMYTGGDSATEVCVRSLSERWEGEFRPGHLLGVATVVAKLLNIVQPDSAYFGEKDWQQCRVVERMVKDLNFPVELRYGPTVREPDGLAMSSRNARLAPNDRTKAAALYHTLHVAAESVVGGRDPRAVEREAIDRLLASGFSKVDYIAAVDGMTLEPIDAPNKGARVIAAAHIGGVRLIDNVAVD